MRRLVDHECRNELDSLINCLSGQIVGAFGSKRFPFYELHAKLYLLIALARVVVDNAAVLKQYAKLFARIALEGLPHILTQKIAADIGVAIERNAPLSYVPEVLVKLQQVGTSLLPVKLADIYRYRVHTPWHVDGQVDLTLNLHFGYDFDGYWLKPLGEIFGISEKQAIELARDVAVHNLQIADTDSYPKDPRQKQWDDLNRFDWAFNTWHDHESYPFVDNYSFYYSYHTCLCVASRLLTSMQVVHHHKTQYKENRWEDWLANHLLTRSDGKWLADRRDPSPIKCRPWVSNSQREHWEWGVRSDDFIDMLLQEGSLRGSVTVAGHWVECDGSCEEAIHVASALVHSARAETVAASLRVADDKYWSLLPQFGEDPSDSRSEMTGWICQANYGARRLDAYDPYAKEIQYPPPEVGEPFLSMLKLSPDSERRIWRLPGISEPSMISEVWSDKPMKRRDEPHRFGKRIQASAELLKRLLATTQSDLLMEVRIKRGFSRDYSSAHHEDFGPMPFSRKVFVLSADGVVRDKQKRYQVL